MSKLLYSIKYSLTPRMCAFLYRTHFFSVISLIRKGVLIPFNCIDQRQIDVTRFKNLTSIRITKSYLLAYSSVVWPNSPKVNLKHTLTITNCSILLFYGHPVLYSYLELRRHACTLAECVVFFLPIFLLRTV